MNCLLLDNNDFVDQVRVRISDGRFTHVRDVLRATASDRLRVGLVGGKLGTGVVEAIDRESCVLWVSWEREPPPPLPLVLVLALPRPKSMRKALHAGVVMGVKRIVLLGAWRVDKSYWNTPWLEASYLRSLVRLALAQAVDTIEPTIDLRRHFKPFVEDELPSIARGSRALVAHPGAAVPCPYLVDGRLTLAIGPEGGFSGYEIEKLAACGFEPVSLGPRIMRVEEAVPALIGRVCSC